jgi:hypothetical protein
MSEDPRRFKPLMHPAGSDNDLARVLGDVAGGRWMGMADLLGGDADGTGDHQLRCTRVTLLAKVAASSNAVEEWLRERPRDGQALVMAARVAVERACRAVDAGVREAWTLLERAELQCRQACGIDPRDPAPYLGLLALACTREDRDPGPQALPVSGPWNSFRDLWRVDSGNREAHHRMMTAVGGGRQPHPADAQMFAHSTVASVGLDVGSPLQLLPLYALIGIYEHQRQTRRGELFHLLWTGEGARKDIERAWTWFEHADPRKRLVVDLSHLTHALCASRQFDRAAAVFTALGPYGSPRPWNTVTESGDAVEGLVRARALAFSAAQQPPDPGGGTGWRGVRSSP